MAKKQKPESSAPFYEHVRQALNHFRDAAWLGENSPLAAPYFLGAALERTRDGTTAVSRGRVLQRELQAAAASLWTDQLPHGKDQLVTVVNEARSEVGNKGNAYYYLLLELRYFRLFFKNSYPRADNEQDIRDYLGVGRGPYFNHVKAAREALGEALLRRLQPTFRLERPLSPTTDLLGRERAARECMTALHEGQTVAISGMGGTGKTSLAAVVAAEWHTAAARAESSSRETAVFWFTLRPTLNDRLRSLLFALGYYLHRHGASSLWRQLVADQGRLDDPNLALALVRGDLGAALGRELLLCFDEVDHLYSDDPDKTAVSQLQMREFVAGLRGLCPILLVGQRHLLPADRHVTLTGLTDAQTATLLEAAGISATTDEVGRLHDYTGGNPRLLNLVITLHDHGKPLAEIIDYLPQAPALQALFAYLWQRLDDAERALLQMLAVFRSPAPDDAWGAHQPALRSLQKRQLAQRDEGGGVMLLPLLRDFIAAERRWLPAERREQCHLWAAQIRATRGEYTAAAYHYSRAGEDALAVQVWFPQRQQEIARGQAAAALSIFGQMSARRLPAAEVKALALLRAELYQLHGEPEKGLAELDSTDWAADEELAVEVRLLQGRFLQALGYTETAVTRQDEGIATILRLLRQLTRFRYQRGVWLMQQRNMREAWRESKLAQYEAEHLQGVVQEERGNYDEAHLSYERALVIARALEHDAGLARTNRELAALLGRQGRLEEARRHAERAIATYQKIGDRMNQETVRCYLAQAYIQVGQFADAITAAEPALAFFQEAKLPYWTAVTAANLAEAHFEVGNLDQATEYAQQVLALEERHTHPYAWYTMGLVQRKRGNSAVAIECFQTCQQLAAGNDDPFIEAYAWRLLGELWREGNLPDQARLAFQRSRQQFAGLSMDAEAAVSRELQDSVYPNRPNE